MHPSIHANTHAHANAYGQPFGSQKLCSHLYLTLFQLLGHGIQQPWCY